MALPGVKIKIENGLLLRSLASNDGVCGLIVNGAAAPETSGQPAKGTAAPETSGQPAKSTTTPETSGQPAKGTTVLETKTAQLNTPYNVFSIAEVEALGIMATGANTYAHRVMSEFYAAAGTGTELWFMLTASATKMEEMAEKYAPSLLNKASGRIKLLGFTKEAMATAPTGAALDNGIDASTDKTLQQAQKLADEFREKFMPFRALVDAPWWNGVAGDLKNYRQDGKNACGVVLCSQNGSKNAAIGLVLGTLSQLPVQRKLSRVKNGSLNISNPCFTNGADIESHRASWDAIHDKGYIFFRDYIGKSGYFFNDDPAATALTDDYASLARGRVIDKAIRIAYIVYTNEIGEEILIDESGKIHVSIIKSLQGTLESRLRTSMQANGELSEVQVIIDPNQNVLSTDTLVVSVRLLPVGYANYINVSLGFTTKITQ